MPIVSRTKRTADHDGARWHSCSVGLCFIGRVGGVYSICGLGPYQSPSAILDVIARKREQICVRVESRSAVGSFSFARTPERALCLQDNTPEVVYRFRHHLKHIGRPNDDSGCKWLPFLQSFPASGSDQAGVPRQEQDCPNQLCSGCCKSSKCVPIASERSTAYSDEEKGLLGALCLWSASALKRKGLARLIILEELQGSCPVAWCSWRRVTNVAGESRAGQLAIAVRLTLGSPLNGAIVPVSCNGRAGRPIHHSVRAGSRR
ncbi:hypothetical protein ABIB68_007881 [Bradyrhizobium sp. F1.2.2]